MARSRFYKLRYQQVSGLVLVTVLCMLAALFTVINAGLNRDLGQLREMAQEGGRLVAEKERQVNNLKNQLALAGTDEFIANEARTRYGYLADGEIRFVVTNPEVLWGEEGMPAASPQP